MRIAITGGTGFVGSHLARALAAAGDEVVLLARGNDRREADVFQLPGAAFHSTDLTREEDLLAAFEGCAAVVHCAGINREIGSQTYQRVHVQATQNVCNAARRAGVRKIVMLSFLRARPDCGSPYHESKWAAEQIVRASGLDFTILKAGVIYGRGDHMLDHLSKALFSFPLFATVGFQRIHMRPLAVEDLVQVLSAALAPAASSAANNARLSNRTFSITGPDEITLSTAVNSVARAIGRKPWIFPAPLAFHYVLAWFAERIMRIPMTSLAQVRILSESLVEPLPPCDGLPDDLQPQTPFTTEQIRKGLPPPGGFSWRDLRISGK